MSWTDEEIEMGVFGLMNHLGIEYMPTNMQMRENRLSGLSAAIGKNGGTEYWRKKLGLKKKNNPMRKWTDDKIENGIKEIMKTLNIDRMPSASELKSIGRNDIHCAISKHDLKYSGWAEKLGIERKSSDTLKGQEYEGILERTLKEKGYTVERMTTKYPYDLVVNDHVKVDVKVGGAHYHYNSRCHTFRPSKVYPTCDLYICLALDEEENIEKTFVIPSKLAQLVTLNICKESKYNVFINRWDYIDRFTEFYKTLKMEGM